MIPTWLNVDIVKNGKVRGAARHWKGLYVPFAVERTGELKLIALRLVPTLLPTKNIKKKEWGNNSLTNANF
jgi:hypothetical protein